MTIAEALALIEEGATIIGGITPVGGVAATVDETAQLASLIASQLQTYQAMSGQPIQSVLDLLTYENPDPSVTS